MRRAPAVSNSSIYGPNAWLIDEQFQQYSKDPNSVDKEWREVFEKNGAPKKQAEAAQSASSASVKKDSAPQSKAKATEGQPTEEKQAARKTVVEAAAGAAEGLPTDPGPAGLPAKRAPAAPLDRIEPYREIAEKRLKCMFEANAMRMDHSLEISTAGTGREMPVKPM